MSKIKIVVGSDGSGFHLKNEVVQHLEKQNYEIIDVGTINENEPVDYFVVGKEAANIVAVGDAKWGVIFCGNGFGVGLAATYDKRVTPIVCANAAQAKSGRSVNNANIIAMGGELVTPYTAKQMVDVFLNTEFGTDLSAEVVDYLEHSFVELKK